MWASNPNPNSSLNSNPNPNHNPNQVGMTGWDAHQLRVKMVQWLQDNGARAMDDGSAPGGSTLLRDSIGVPNWNEYIQEMGMHDVTWGDEATLLAASVFFKVVAIQPSPSPSP